MRLINRAIAWVMDWGFLLLIVAVIGGIFIGTFEQLRHAKYSKGAYVENKLDGRVGVIIYLDTTVSGLNYIVRFSAFQEKTNTHVIEPDGPILQSPYADVSCKEFELEPAEQPKRQSEH